MRTTFTWITTTLGVFLLAVTLIPACGQGDGDALPTSSSAMSSDGSLALASPVSQRDDDSEDGDSNDEDSSDDGDSLDDDSSDNDSNGEDSNDDSESLDDDSGDGDAGLAGGDLEDNGTRVRDVLLAVDACPTSFTVSGTLVNATAETRFDCEPGCDGLFERLSSDQFCPFVVPGLPIRARGTNDTGTINASRVRIDDEIKVTGTIAVGSAALAPGTPFTLSVLGLGDLQFVVAPGALIDTFAAGSTVRVEGVVPPLTAGGGLPTFGATEIQN